MVLVGAWIIFVIPKSLAVMPLLMSASGNKEVNRPKEARKSKIAVGERIRVQLEMMLKLLRWELILPEAAGPGTPV